MGARPHVHLLEIVMMVGDLYRLVRRLTLGAAVKEGLEARKRDNDDGKSHLDHAEGVYGRG